MRQAATATAVLWHGDTVMHDDREWTVDAVSLIDDEMDWWDVKLHRLPGRQDDALSEEWLDVTASGDEEWEVFI